MTVEDVVNITNHKRPSAFISYCLHFVKSQVGTQKRVVHVSMCPPAPGKQRLVRGSSLVDLLLTVKCPLFYFFLPSTCHNSVAIKSSAMTNTVFSGSHVMSGGCD